MLIFFLKLETKTCWKCWRGSSCKKGKNGCFRERRTSFSLDYRAIRPSAVVGTRREVAIRGETYAWAPNLRSFDKLREIGDLSYLGFILYLSVFTIFELIEAVNGRLIGPKTWDRIVRISCAKMLFLKRYIFRV